MEAYSFHFWKAYSLKASPKLIAFIVKVNRIVSWPQTNSVNNIIAIKTDASNLKNLASRSREKKQNGIQMTAKKISLKTKNMGSNPLILLLKHHDYTEKNSYSFRFTQTLNIENGSIIEKELAKNKTSQNVNQVFNKSAKTEKLSKTYGKAQQNNQ